MSVPEPAAVVELRPRRGPVKAAIVALRPRQWSKNLLLFAGLIFAAKLGDAGRWGEAVAIFVAYCAASSAAYLVNDLLDADDDRLHPVKRDRPIARGELEPQRALVLAGLLAAGAFAIAAALGFSSVLFLLGFVALQLAYSLGVKRIVLVDVLRHRRPFRDSRGGRRRGRRRAHLSVAARVHRVAGALPRAGEAPRRARARARGRDARARGARRLLARARRPVAERRRGGDGRRLRRVHRDRALRVDGAHGSVRRPRARPLSRARAPARSRRGAGARAALGPRDPRDRRRMGRPLGRRPRA